MLGERKTSPATPRYAQIHQYLEHAIVSGAWPPGHRVPSERELVVQYACSRMTVHRALRALAAVGLITRRRRSGTFVAQPTSQKSILDIPDIEAEVRRAGRSYRFKLLSRSVRKATREDLRRLRIRRGATVLALKGVHFAEDLPLVLEDRVINLVAVPAARCVDFKDSPPGGWLLARIPWSGAEHHIRAVNASAADARALAIRPREACLVIERNTWHAAKSITHVILTYPGERQELVARFSPTSGPRPRRAAMPRA